MTGDGAGIRGVVLVVDDDPDILRLFAAILSATGLEVVPAASASEARRVLEDADRPPFDAILLDLWMEEESGLDFLGSSRGILQEIPVVVATTSTRVQDAVAALKAGAFDYLTKPVRPEDLALTMSHAVERRQMLRELRARRVLSPDVQISDGTAVFAGPVMRGILGVLLRVADSTVPVLFLGESGTGKEVVAQTLHRYGKRSRGPFVAVNCAALPRDIVESELFGHERGAFTGAASRREGRFEEAKGGTLFLDEIGELDLGVQAKLLRVLQEKELQRVGGGTVSIADVRVIAATNRDLAGDVRAGRFREDLLYRLDVISFRLPPLRERRDEIAVLASHLLVRFVDHEGLPERRLSDGAIRALEGHTWPGNVRELENVLKRTALLSPGPEIEAEDIRWESAVSVSAPPPTASREVAAPAVADEAAPSTEAPVRSFRELEPELMLRALAETGGNVSEAARRLGIGRATFYRRARRHRLDV